MKLVISPLEARKWLGIIAIGLFLASLASLAVKFFVLKFAPDVNNIDLFVDLFHLDREKNLPSLFSFLLLFISSICLAIIALGNTRANHRYKKHWFALSLIFLFLSIDEWNSFHELLTDPLRANLNTSGIFFFAWVIVAIPLVATIFLVYLKFLRDLPPHTKKLFFMAGGLYLSGTLGMELINGYYFSQNVDAILTQEAIPAMIYAVMTHIEELLEMIGIVTFIYALTSYMSRYVEQLEIWVDDRQKSSISKM
jgi:hypothetical protein